MKVKCIANYGSAIPEKHREHYCGEDSYFPVEIDQVYNVYAMGNQVGSPILQYLISDDLGYPRYCPSNLFEVIDHDLPLGFGFNEWKIGSFHYRIWGYKQILDYKHHEGLIEQNPHDIEMFTKARNDMDDRFKEEKS